MPQVNHGPLRVRAAYLSFLLACVMVAGEAHPQKTVFKVVNMIPRTLAGDSIENSEPFVSAHPTEKGAFVATAFASGGTWCPLGLRAPIFVSNDDGDTWSLACIIPRAATNHYPLDMTVRFNATGTSLVVGSMDSRMTADGFLQTAQIRQFSSGDAASPHSGAQLMSDLVAGDTASDTRLHRTMLFSRSLTDQPQVVGASSADPDNILIVAADRSSLGPNNVCLFGFAHFTADKDDVITCFDSRDRRKDDETMAVRAAMHRDGTAYALFYRSVKNVNASADVVVMRRDAGSAAFNGITDDPRSTPKEKPASASDADCVIRDGQPGYRLVRCAAYPVRKARDDDFGQERRLESQISVAIDPNSSDNVFVAWAEQSKKTPNHLELHFSWSDRKGVAGTWKDVGFTIDDATNPALAVASDGAVGLLYQQLVGKGSTARWQTWFSLSTDGMQSWPNPELLADVDALDPKVHPAPYLGDYINLGAQGLDFYGVFSASNNRMTGKFHPNTTFDRYYDATTMLPVDAKTGGKSIPVSIDPYFVKVTRSP
jgi:hypothetical protein